jgi:hypothetical protein
LLARLRILLADVVDGAGVQAQFLAAAGGQLDQVKSRVPWPVEAQRILLPVVAIVPDKVHLSRLLIEQAGQGFDAIEKDQFNALLTDRAGIGSLTNRKSVRPLRSRLLSLPVLKDEVSRSKI